MPLENLFFNPVPPTRNDPANYRRAALFFFVICPIAFCLYLVFGDMIIAPAMSFERWSREFDSDGVIQVPEINSNEFELFNSITNKVESIVIARDSDSCSIDDLDALLLQNGLQVQDQTHLDFNTKTDLLLRLSSPDFWRKNWVMHPKRGRVQHWLVKHKELLKQMESFGQSKDRQALKTAFNAFNATLMDHLEFEESYLYPFLGNDVGVDIVTDLNASHGSMHQQTANIAKLLENDKENPQIMDLMAKYEKYLVDHFTKEEQEIVGVMLGLENWLYRHYRSQLNWRYYWKTTS